MTTISTKQKKDNNILEPHKVLAYQGAQEEDLCILKWYFELSFSNILKEFVTIDINTPYEFLRMCQQPNAFLYMVNDDRAIIHASCFIPFMSGACVSVWAAPHARGTRSQLFFTQEVLKAATTTWPVIIALTKDETLVPLYEKAGFQLLGNIPWLIDGQLGFCLYITKAMYTLSDFSKLGGSNENL